MLCTHLAELNRHAFGISSHKDYAVSFSFDLIPAHDDVAELIALCCIGFHFLPFILDHSRVISLGLILGHRLR